MKLTSLVALTILTMATAQADASAKDGAAPALSACMKIVKSPVDAAEKADWIVEGKFDFAMSSSEVSALSLTLGDTRTIKGGWPTHDGSTIAVPLGQCFADGNGPFDAAAAKRLVGQRLRLYGSKHLFEPRRLVFYMEPAKARMAPTPPDSSTVRETRIHRQNASNPGPNGWHRARSTEGGYAIDMPAPFMDVTGVSTGPAGPILGFLLKTSDANGATFMAVREPNSPDAPMAGSFDTEMKNKHGNVVQFKGTSAIETRVDHGAVIMHSLMFRAPGGTYMLGLSVPKEREQASKALCERYYQSFAFD